MQNQNRNFFRKPSRSPIPEPANETKSGDGSRKPMEMEPESEHLAKRTYGRKLIPEPTKQKKTLEWNKKINGIRTKARTPGNENKW